MRQSGRFGEFGGVFVGEILVPALEELEAAVTELGLSTRRAESLLAADRGVLVLAGLTSVRGPAATALRVLDAPLPEGAEALVVQRVRLRGRPALVLCGSDSRGLMYAALDTADRIRAGGDPQDPLALVRDVSETPFLRELQIF